MRGEPLPWLTLTFRAIKEASYTISFFAGIPLMLLAATLWFAVIAMGVIVKNFIERNLHHLRFLRPSLSFNSVNRCHLSEDRTRTKSWTAAVVTHKQWIGWQLIGTASDNCVDAFRDLPRNARLLGASSIQDTQTLYVVHCRSNNIPIANISSW